MDAYGGSGPIQASYPLFQWPTSSTEPLSDSVFGILTQLQLRNFEDGNPTGLNFNKKARMEVPMVYFGSPRPSIPPTKHDPTPESLITTRSRHDSTTI